MSFEYETRIRCDLCGKIAAVQQESGGGWTFPQGGEALRVQVLLLRAPSEALSLHLSVEVHVCPLCQGLEVRRLLEVGRAKI